MNQEKDIQVSVKEAYGNAVSLLESGNYELAEKQLAEDAFLNMLLLEQDYWLGL